MKNQFIFNFFFIPLVSCVPYISTFAQDIVPQMIYSDPGLTGISNVVINQEKIGFVAYSDPVTNFPGYPDPNSAFQKLKWVREDAGAIVELEDQSVADAYVNLTTAGGQDDLVFLTYRKPTGFMYGFEGKYWILDGDQALSEETIFPNANFGISSSLNIGSDGYARMVSFSAAGYALIFHNNFNGSWANLPATSFNQQHWSLKSILDDSDNLHIASIFSTGGQVDLKYYTADPNMGNISGTIVDQSIENVCDLLYDPVGRLQILYTKEGNLHLATLENGSWMIELLDFNLTTTDGVSGRADMAYISNGDLLLGYQTTGNIFLKQRPSTGSWETLFSFPVESDYSRPTVLTFDDGSFQMVWSNNNEVFKLGSASLSGESRAGNKIALLYPNPSSGQFSVSCSQAIKETITIRVLDANGKEVYNKKETEMAASFYLPDFLPPGLYFVSGTDSAGNRLFFEKLNLTR